MRQKLSRFQAFFTSSGSERPIYETVGDVGRRLLDLTMLNHNGTSPGRVQQSGNGSVSGNSGAPQVGVQSDWARRTDLEGCLTTWVELVVEMGLQVQHNS